MIACEMYHLRNKNLIAYSGLDLLIYFNKVFLRSMKQSWGFLIARQYNYQFENFYAVVIQRAYRNYKKRPESLAKQVWEAVRNDGTPDNKKFLDIVSRDKIYHFING